ncbi:MAG: hypothetical protein O7F76_01035 [Planctomycetota bacterium]|nr:hypothetical protein [Planctomycetota bacterium]
MIKQFHLDWLVVAVLISTSAFAPNVRAELILLTNGDVRVGRVVSESPAQIRLLTGTASKSREIKVDRDEIRDILQGLKESERIVACESADDLERWSAAYFQGGLEIPSARCIRRLLELEAGAAAKPRRDGTDGFRSFWNRVVFGEMKSDVSQRTPDRCVELAKWAWTADLKSDAARFLRRAWSAETGSAEIRSLASEWGVRLASQFLFDLTPALEQSLFSDFILDEGIRVNAESGKEFLTLPIRYEGAEPGQVLKRSTFSFKEVRGGYGFRSLRVKGGAPVIETLAREAVYERLELSAKPGSPRQLIAKNTSGPRLAEGAGDPPDRIGPKERRLRATGWAAILIEVDKTCDSLTISGMDGASDVLDISMLRRIRDPLGADANTSSSPAMKAALTALEVGDTDAVGAETGSGTMASLAITRLARWRDRPGANPSDAWMRAVDRAVIEAAARDEERLGPSAWAYLSNAKQLSDATADLFAQQPGEQQVRWIRIVESAADCKSDFDLPLATFIIRSILRGNDATACDAALEFMIGWGHSADWSALAGASETARSLAFARLGSQIDSKTASDVLVALMQGSDPTWAEDLSRIARHLGLRLSDGHHPILKSWRSLTDEKSRVAFLRVMREVSLEQVIHSPHFAEVERDALNSTSEAVREAAFEMFIEEGRRQGVGDSAFGLLVPRNVGDPLIRGLSMAVRIGAPDTRIAAMEILVRAGFAEEAVRGVVAGVKDGREQDRVFLKFLDRLGPESQYDGMLSFMALLLRPEWHSSAQYVVTRLKQRAAGTDAPNRWRVLVAAKSGADFGSLSDSSLQLEPPLSVGVLAWLYHLTHASPQERKRLTAARGTQSRIELLRDIDFRRGQLVDGLYGVAAIVETVSVVDKAERRLVWSRPRREMTTLPALSLRLRGDDNSYVVTWNDRTIGSGVVLDRPQPIRRLELEYYYGVMEQLDATPFVGGEPAGEDSARSKAVKEPIGPIVLRSGRVDPAMTPGMMSLEIGELLKAGLTANGNEIVAHIAPESLTMTLRYMAFGGYCGTAQRRPLPNGVPVGHRHMLNVKIILERVE